MARFDPDSIKSDFPILKKLDSQGNPLVYLDNAATSQKPRQVIQAIADYYEQTNANVGRGVYQLAEESTQAYESARKTVAEFIHAKTEEIIFTKNTTEALNLVAHSLAATHLVTGDEVVLTASEHHSSLLPWQRVAREKNVSLRFVEINQDGELNLEYKRGDKTVSLPYQIGGLQEQLTDRTRVVVLPHVSNVVGRVNDIQKIVRIVKKYNPEIVVVVDGAQAVPHLPVAVSGLGCDFYAFSGHKMLGPTGIGVLWTKSSVAAKLEPLLTGGGMIDSVAFDQAMFSDPPSRFEAGTPPIAQAVGLAAACDYLTSIGMDTIASHEQDLLALLLHRFNDHPKITVLGGVNPAQRSGLVSFTIQGVHPHDVAQVLASVGVAVRSGFHCAQPLHDLLSLPGSVRVSPYLYNTQADINQFFKGIEKVYQVFQI